MGYASKTAYSIYIICVPKLNVLIFYNEGLLDIQKCQQERALLQPICYDRELKSCIY